MATDDVPNLRPLDIDRDAEALARMWNESDAEWPGSWTGGVPETAEVAAERERLTDPIEVVVWEAGEDIAGYGAMRLLPREEGVSYVNLLNVAPRFQGRGLARKMLTRFVERAAAMGHRRIDLHTWPGNRKSVPLYKKCGFFWEPKSDVHMLNFLPAILRMALTRLFFDRHGWYGTQQRELSVAEDRDRWEGMRVYTQRFAADGEELVYRIDRHARTVTGVETPDVAVAAIAAAARPPRGLPTGIRWVLENRGARPLPVTLIAGATRDIRLEHEETLVLEPGERREIVAEIDVPARAPKRKEREIPRVKTLLVVDGLSAELGTGFRPRSAVEIETIPKRITLSPGRESTVHLALRNRVPAPLTAEIAATPDDALTADWTAREVSLEPLGRAGASLVLRADEEGGFDLPISVSFDADGRHVRLPAEPRRVVALEAGGLVVAEDEEGLRVETDVLRTIIEREGGAVALLDPATEEHLGTLNGWPSPPFWPNEFASLIHDLTEERAGPRTKIVATAESERRPGLVLRKEITIDAAGGVAVEHTLLNRSPEPLELELAEYMGLDPSMLDLTLPLAEGLTRGPAGDFPGASTPAFKRPGSYAECWAAYERPSGAALGLIWSGDRKRIEFAPYGNAYLFSDKTTLAPRTAVRYGPTRLLVTRGGFAAVRDACRRIRDGRTLPPSVRDRTPKSALTARVGDGSVIALSDRTVLPMRIEHRVPRGVSGRACFVLPKGWRAEPDEIPFEEAMYGEATVSEVAILAPDAPCAAVGRIEVDAGDTSASVPLPLVRLGDGSPVEVRSSESEGLRLFTLSTGRIEIDVCPDFAGTVTALREGDVNHLKSAFPTPTDFGWLSPFHGGVQPALGRYFPGRLRDEAFRSELVEVKDRQGVVWSGVRLAAVLSEDEENRGFRVEADYLTTGGSRALRVSLRACSAGSAPWSPRLCIQVFTQPDGELTRTHLVGPGHRLPPSDRLFAVHAGEFAAALDARTGRGLVLVPDRPDAALDGWGEDGGHLRVIRRLLVPPGGTEEITALLVLVDSEEEARAHAHLGPIL